MTDILHLNKTFEKVLYTDKFVNGREFESCVFKNCDFSNTDFSDSVFMDCEFIDCNLSMVKLRNASLKTVAFKDCKILGVMFNECTDFLFSVSFADCTLDYASFINKKMPKIKIVNCLLRETNFTGTILTKAVFQKCNFDNAVFNNTQLDEADFSTAYNYKIDPEFNSVRKAKFALAGIPGLLDKYDIRIA